MDPLLQRIEKIEARNQRVEAEKAWETSVFRITLIATLTYMVAFVALYYIGNANPLRNALIPALGYLLSTQSIPFVKRLWIDRHLAKRATVEE